MKVTTDELEVLKRAHELVLERWTTGSYSVKARRRGEVVVLHCAVGALNAAATDLYGAATRARWATAAAEKRLTRNVPLRDSDYHGCAACCNGWCQVHVVTYNDRQSKDKAGLTAISDLFVDAIADCEDELKDVAA